MKTLPNISRNHVIASRGGFSWNDFNGSVALVFIDEELYCGGIIRSITKSGNGGTELDFELFVFARDVIDIVASKRLVKRTDWVREEGRKMAFAAEPRFFREHLVIIDEGTNTKVVIPPAAEHVLRWLEDTNHPPIPTK